MIEVGGKQFVTLDDDMYVDGAKVAEVYVDGTKVYPEATGNGLTCIEALFVHKAQLTTSYARYISINWGDGETLYLSGDDAGGAYQSFTHEYEDDAFHLVTICIAPIRAGSINNTGIGIGEIRFRALGIIQGGAPTPNPRDYDGWCGNMYGFIDPSSPYWKYRSRILREYEGAMVAWSIKPGPPTIHCYINTLSQEHIQTNSSGYFSISTEFMHLYEFFPGTTTCRYGGYLKLENWF